MTHHEEEEVVLQIVYHFRSATSLPMKTDERTFPDKKTAQRALTEHLETHTREIERSLGAYSHWGYRLQLVDDSYTYNKRLRTHIKLTQDDSEPYAPVIADPHIIRGVGSFPEVRYSITRSIP